MLAELLHLSTFVSACHQSRSLTVRLCAFSMPFDMCSAPTQRSATGVQRSIQDLKAELKAYTMSLGNCEAHLRPGELHEQNHCQM